LFEKCREKIREYRSLGSIHAHGTEILSMLLKCRQCLISTSLLDKQNTMSSKIDWVIKKISTNPDEKTLVFCHFIHEMNVIREKLVASGANVEVMSGRNSNIEREKSIEKFKGWDSGVFIIQIETGGVGLNLQEATNIIITSPTWNPASELQAIGRSYRTGQTNEVNVHRLIAAGDCQYPLIDDCILGLQQSKSVLCAGVLEDPRIIDELPITGSVKSLTVRDVCDCFLNSQN